MTENNATNTASSKKRKMEIPELRRIDWKAGPECLLLGLRDFAEAPKYGFFFGGFYAFGGWLLVAFLFMLSLPFLAFPAAMGFALVAPFVAAGIYEVSRRLESGEPLSWGVVFGTAWKQQKREMGWMALITGFAFFIWVDYAALVFLLFFGLNELNPEAFFKAVTTTYSGLYFILLGNFAGAILATIVFSVTVVSFPLLMDRDIDFVTAITTSVKAVTQNIFPMFIWAGIIGVSILISFMTFFIALPVLLPVLGHGTWHMYRKVVASAVQPEAERL